MYVKQAAREQVSEHAMKMGRRKEEGVQEQTTIYCLITPAPVWKRGRQGQLCWRAASRRGTNSHRTDQTSGRS